MKLASLPRSLARAAAIALCLAATACASTPSTQTATPEVFDPLEPVNRIVFGFNEATDILLIRPAAEVYTHTVPDPIREVVNNFLRNLLAPIDIANQILQGDFEGAQLSTGRFLTNTILGAGGLADVATAAGIRDEREDFGQTLGVWGVAEGPYLVLPLLGPSNLRDTVGFVADTVADPVRIWAYGTDHKGLLRVRAAASVLDRRSQLLTQVDDLRRNSLDFYSTVRSLYGQQRAAAIKDQRGGGAAPEFPEYSLPDPAKKP